MSRSAIVQLLVSSTRTTKPSRRRRTTRFPFTGWYNLTALLHPACRRTTSTLTTARAARTKQEETYGIILHQLSQRLLSKDRITASKATHGHHCFTCANDIRSSPH